MAKEYTWQDFEALNKQKITKMQLDDPLLRAAYLYAMGVVMCARAEQPKWIGLVFRDIRRRGNSAVPLLLSLFQENRGFRNRLMVEIDSFGLSQADIEPILKAARSLALEEGRKLPITSIYGIATMLSRHGTKDDIHILEQLDFDPKTGAGVHLDDDIRRLKERLAKEEKQRK